MMTRIIIIIVTAAFIDSVAFGQMKYSRSRSASPTPTPTPLPLIPAQKTTTPPRTTPPPTPAKPTLAPRVTPTPAQPKPTPAQTQLSALPSRTIPPILAKPTPSPKAALMQSPATSQRVTSTAIQPKPVPTPAPMAAKPTPTPVPPPDVKAYLDRQVATSKDQKFHMTINGKDLALTPFHVWRQKETGPNTTSTCIDMRGDDGRIYDIDFVTAGAQVSGIKIHKINGEALR